MNLKDFAMGDMVSIDLIKEHATKLGIVRESGSMKQTQWGNKPCIMIEMLDTTGKPTGKLLAYYPNRRSVKNVASGYGFDTTGWVNKHLQFRVEVIKAKGTK